MAGYHLFEALTLFLVSIVMPTMHIATIVNERGSGVSDSRVRREEVHGLVAGLSILLWWNMLYYILPFRHTGPLVLIIQEIMRDMSVFILLVITVLAGFTVAFFVLFNHSDCKVSDCKTEDVVEAFG